MKRTILTAIASILMLFASVSSAFACAWLAYQPKTPKSLQK